MRWLQKHNILLTCSVLIKFEIDIEENTKELESINTFIWGKGSGGEKRGLGR